MGKYKQLLEQMDANSDKHYGDFAFFNDMFEIIREYHQVDKQAAYVWNSKLQKMCNLYIRGCCITGDTQSVKDANRLYRRATLFAAYDSVDDYLLFLEWERPPKEKFYMPRRKVLLPIVKKLDLLSNNELVNLIITLPPGVGKSTLGIMYMTREMGKFPEKSNLMTGHSSRLTDGFYKEVKSIITGNDIYTWGEMFSSVPFEGDSALNTSVNLGQPARFPTLTCRSIAGTLTGAVRASGIIIADDLVEDLEEALSEDRLEKKVQAYANQVQDRRMLGAKNIMIGTPWSINDPLARFEKMWNETSPKTSCRISIPALTPEGESNFNYKYEKGFDKEYFENTKLLPGMDDITFDAKFQQEPVERKGLLFAGDELNYYDGTLPTDNKNPLTRISSFNDVAWGGGDFLVNGFFYEYKNGDTYVHDVVCSQGTKMVTVPEIVAKMLIHQPNYNQVEANNGGHMYGEEVQRASLVVGLTVHMRALRAPNNTAKHVRITQWSDTIKHKMFFRDKAHRDSEYAEFMMWLIRYPRTGKGVRYDDPPDMLAMAAADIYRLQSSNAIAMSRPGG